MAFGILKAGFLAGAATRASSTIDAVAAANAEQRKIEEERAYQKGLRQQERNWQLADQASQQNFQIQQAEQSALVQAANIDQQHRNKLDIIGRQEAAQKAADQLKREDDLLKQLEQEQEREAAQKKLSTDPNATIVLSPDAGTLYRAPARKTPDANEKYKAEGPFKGVKVLFSMPDPANPENSIPVPIRVVDREKLTEGELPDFGVRHVMDSTKDYLPALVEMHRKDTYKEGFDAIIREISQLSGAGLREFLDKTTTKQDNEGYTVLANPVNVFQLATYLPNMENREYFARKVFGPLLNVQGDVIARMLGIPVDVELGYSVDNEGNEFFILPPRHKYNWATVPNPQDENARPVLDPTVQKNVIQIANGSQMPVLEILGVVTDFKKFDDKKAVLKDLLFMQTQYKDGSVRYTQEGRMIPTESFQLDMRDRISGMSVDNGINFIRATMPPPKSKPTESIVFKDGTATNSVIKSYGKKYGRDPEMTGRRADSSRQAVRIIDQIETLANETSAQFGAKGQVIKITAGLKDLYSGLGMIVNSLTNAGVGIDPEDAAAIKDAAGRLVNLEEGQAFSADEIFGPQGVLGILTEQLAFVVAGAFQGGAKGNNISNADVQAARNALSLLDFFGNRQMSLAALAYLKKDMLVTADMNRRYTLADTDEHEFQAVYMYDQIEGGTYDSVMAMLADPNSPFAGMGGTKLQQATDRPGIRRVQAPTGNGSASGFVFETSPDIPINPAQTQ